MSHTATLPSDASVKGGAIEDPIHAGLTSLANFISNARIEIAAIEPCQINSDHIPLATDELDAIVSATEKATNQIMDICDEITALASSCPPGIAEKLIACTTRLFEACNFQDITGQRITKVVQTLKQIDAKVAALLKVFGGGLENGMSMSSPLKATGDAALLNGPALPKDAVDQDQIDRLLSEA